jgi:hypothetical protein
VVGNLAGLAGEPAGALRGEVLLVSYDVSDLVPAGPEAAKLTAALAEEIKAKVEPGAWKPGVNTVTAGDRGIAITVNDARLAERVTEFLLAAYAERMPRENKELHEKLAKKAPADFATPVTVAAALETLEKSSGLKVTIDPQAKDRGAQPLSLRLKEASAGLTLRWLTRAAGLDWEFREGGIVFFRPPDRGMAALPRVPLHRAAEGARVAKEIAARTAAVNAASGKELAAHQFKAELLGECLEWFRQTMGVDIVCDPGCEPHLGYQVSLDLEDMTAGQALTVVLRAAGLRGGLRDGAILVIPVRELNLPPSVQERLARKLVSFEWTEKPAGEALRFLGEESGVKIVIDESAREIAKRTVTLRMKDASTLVALELLLRRCHAGGQARDGVVHIVPGE